ncbi:chaplin [Streptacidiphilus sp. EB129]|uniref:chaplin n=1 Tax=Streptacidiphilus sp. EB129 TaxID=3156262 RepID=UPI003518E5F8
MQKVMKVAGFSAAALATVIAGAGAASANSTAVGEAAKSPGVLSGNLLQVPIHIPVNLCGDSVNVIGALNPAFGNTCVNTTDNC